ncbi:hypothetical protein P7K49_015098 [Saguinus oedipus]|uniref:Uncharacterized protein n=1 Tax=Saguinus oedipus TaxID=9490 RepID=A0ABQ9V893_SAGOE|nr:hypothetical protein P7K49_015098 [Saguinus oedipus]
MESSHFVLPYKITVPTACSSPPPPRPAPSSFSRRLSHGGGGHLGAPLPVSSLLLLALAPAAPPPGHPRQTLLCLSLSPQPLPPGVALAACPAQEEPPRSAASSAGRTTASSASWTRGTGPRAASRGPGRWWCTAGAGAAGRATRAVQVRGRRGHEGRCGRSHQVGRPRPPLSSTAAWFVLSAGPGRTGTITVIRILVDVTRRQGEPLLPGSAPPGPGYNPPFRASPPLPADPAPRP